MPTALVTYLGEPDKTGDYEFYGEQGTAPWHPGEERELDADHAELFVAVYNMNLKIPRFSLDEKPTGKKRSASSATDTPTDSTPTDPAQPAA